MQLNEIIEENTLASISNRTRLSSENLEHLFKRDFTSFRKVQALGFISILEREYRVDLSQLRAECLAYFEEDTPNEEVHASSVDGHRTPSRRPSPVLDAPMERRRYSLIKPIVVVLIGAALLYAAWWTYTSSKESDMAVSTSGENVGFFTAIVRKAQSWMGSASDNEKPEANVASKKSSAGAVDQGDGSFVIAGASEEPKESANKTPTDGEKDIADLANDASTDESKQQTLEPASQTPAKGEKQPNSSNAVALQEETSSANNSSVPTDTDEAIKKIGDALAAAADETPQTATDTSAPLGAEVPSVSKDSQGDAEERSIIKEATERALKDAQEAKAKQEAAARKQAEEAAARQKAEEEARRIAAEEKARQEQAARKRAAQEKAAREKAARMGVVLVPTKKIWLGIVDLVTMKRSTSVSKKKVTFKGSKGKWIVATGHGWLRFKIGNKELKFNDGKKHFLLIQKGTVKEIPHETFQQLNQSKVW